MGKRKNKKSTIMPLSNSKMTLLSGHLGSYPQFKYRMMNPIIEELYHECVKLDEEETKALNDRFVMVIEKFIEKMKDVDSTFKEIFNRIYSIGGFYNRLRIVEATEFDVNLVLKPNFMVQPIKRGRPPGFTPIRVNNTDEIEIPEIITVETNSLYQTPLTSTTRTPEKRNAEDDITTPSKKRRLEDGNICTESRLDSTFHDTENPIKISGRRIVNIDHFLTSIRNLENHEPFSCNFGNMEVINEKRLGMMDEFTFKCKMCHKVEKITTDVHNDSSLNLNTALVSAMTNTGQGFSQLQEICCCLDMPCMASKTYEKHQQIVNKAIHECTWKSMEDAAKEEATYAIQEGRVDENGVPEITVIVDGAWCKRSYRTNYNASSGVACIMGYKTKKVLFIGIRNTYMCCICARSDSKKETPPDHVCYKNWEKSPNSMEADIIIEGFRKSLKMYNLKYVEVIGDGDSSVMRRLAESLPYGPLTTIRKVECTNHLLRNYIKKLREVGEQRRNSTGPVPRDLRNKVTNNLLRLQHAVTGAVKYYQENNNENDIFETVKCLQEDIRNGPYHVFGVHTKCKDYFCNKTTASDNTKNHSSLVEDMKTYGVWQELMAANNYLACFTYSLYRNVTSNCVESYNAKICKYVGGKRVNFSQRNGYNVRSELSALSFNENEELNRRLHKKITLGKSPGVNSKTLSQSKRRKRQRKRRVLFSDKNNKRCKVFCADEDYGDVQCPALDIEPEDMERRKVDFLQSLSKDEAGRQNLEQQSRGQSHCELWKFERQRRVTASNFGKICKMRNTTSGQKLIEMLLYSEFQGSAATKYGIENEKTAIEKVQDLLGLQIEESGLYVDKNYPFLAASPDGSIDEKGLDVRNIKAPYKNWMLRTWTMGDFLNPNAVRSWLQGVVTKTLYEIEEEGKLFHGCKLKYHQSGPAATLSVTSQEAPSKKIDIDLVPVLEFSTSKRGFYPSLKKGDIRKIGDNEPWFAVPKPPSTNCDLSCHMCLSWRMSFPIQESAIINDLNLFKYTLRMVKKVRDELGIHEVASYYIKTLFLLELNKNGPAMFSECDRGFLFMYFLGCLRTALENGKIPFLWNQNFNLLGNVSECTLTNSAGHLKKFCDKTDKLVEEENKVQLNGVIQSLLNCPQN